VMQGDHKKANQHFLEALRLNPTSENARMGLIESFRARSWPYRLQLRFAHFMNQFTEGRQSAIMIGGFIGYRVLSSYLKTVAPFWANVVIGAWLVFALWSHLARGFSTFFVTLDRFARQALRPREFWEGIVVGGLIFLAPAALVLGYVWDVPGSGMVALICLLSAVTSAAAFTNDHYVGRYVYSVAAAVSCFGVLYCGTAIFANLDLPFAFTAGITSVYIGIATTWLRMLRVLYA
jgi:hypothetical protein